MNQENLYQQLLAKTESKLHIIADKSEENAHNTLSALWHTAAGNRVSPIKANMLELPILAPSQIVLLKNLLNKRLSGTPLAHITERQNFMGIDYMLNKGLYIPRKETELLTKTTIELVQNNYATNKKVVLIDLCCGIGTVALAVAYYCKNTCVYGSDIYEPAINVAKINALHLGLDNVSNFFNADLFEPFDTTGLKNKTDIIVSAPPYISSVKVKQMAGEVSNHEPREAFDAGPFGLSIFNAIISSAPDYLSNNGYLVFECGLGQGEFLSKRLRSNVHYDEVSEICDDFGNIRVLKARRTIE